MREFFIYWLGSEYNNALRRDPRFKGSDQALMIRAVVETFIEQYCIEPFFQFVYYCEIAPHSAWR